MSLTSLLHAQVQLSEKHIKKVNKQKSAAKKLALYRKFYSKDSARYFRNMERYWQAKTDSLTDAMVEREEALTRKQQKISDGLSSKIFRTVYKPWAERSASQQIKWLQDNGFSVTPQFKTMCHAYLVQYFLQCSQSDSMLHSLKQQMPSLALPRQLSSRLRDYTLIHPEKIAALKPGHSRIPLDKGLEKLKGATQYSSSAKQYRELLSDRDSVKHLSFKQGESLATKYAKDVKGIGELTNAQQEVSKLKEMPGDYKTKADQLQDSTYLKEQAKRKAEELAMQYIADHPEVMQGVQRKMAVLMKKYSVVPNSNDLSTAVKRTSLKGRSFKQRLYFAGNFQVISLNPVSIDFSPMIGYRFNTKFIAGVGANYRQSFKDSIPALAPDVWGYKAFTSYDVLKNFFVYAEFDRNSPGVNQNKEVKTKRIWRNAAFLGVGRKLMISPKIEMTVVFMYNFLHEHPDPVYPRPWNVKVGFQTSELAFFKNKPRY